MESELQKFRRRKQLEQKKAEVKSKLQETFTSWSDSLCQALLPSWNDEEEDTPEDYDDASEEPTTSSRSQALSDEVSSSANKSNKWIMYLAYLLRFLSWLLVFIGFVKIGFGAVFFTISLLIFIYLNRRKSRRRKKGEVSAYSAFNKDCKSIHGTLDAEQLEKTMLYRS